MRRLTDRVAVQHVEGVLQMRYAPQISRPIQDVHCACHQRTRQVDVTPITYAFCLTKPPSGKSRAIENCATISPPRIPSTTVHDDVDRHCPISCWK